MEKPWELKNSTIRIEDTRETYIIFCEDSTCEKLYLDNFNDKKVKINTISNYKSHLSNVVNAISYCHENRLFNEEEIIDREGLHVWCVYDADFNKSVSNTNEKVTYNESIPMAKKHNINVAWSNDAFELWVLLHFEEVPINIETSSREYYYHHLDDIFKNLKEQNELLIKAMQHSTFSYKKDLKKHRCFNEIVKPLLILKENRDLAISRAKTLHLHFLSKTKKISEMAPCTCMYLLVEDILSRQGK